LQAAFHQKNCFFPIALFGDHPATHEDVSASPGEVGDCSIDTISSERIGLNVIFAIHAIHIQE